MSNQSSSERRSPGQPRSTAELLERIDTSRAALLRLIEGLSEAQLSEAGPDGGWSIKDHLAHLTVWQQGIVALLRREPRFPAMGFGDETVRRVDEAMLNAMIEERHRDRSASEVLAGFDQAHRELRAVLQALPFDDLHMPYAHYQPGAPVTDDSRPVLGWIAGNTFGHYEEHQPWIQPLVDRYRP